MLFNSYEFIFLFLPVTLAIYFYLNKKRVTIASRSWLLFASLVFYSWWNIRYLPLILGSIIFNYSVGAALSRTKASSRGTILFIGISADLALLGWFKYADFLIANINPVLGSQIRLLHIVLPLGISFFTFTQIAFLVDAFRGEIKEYSLLNYGLFVTFFPHLLAGPILHHKEMMPQFDRTKNKALQFRNLSVGAALFFIGLFKKVIIADTLAAYANNGFDNAQLLTLVEAWVTSLSYTFQIYFDFSGYTDMALGAALMFNIILPINFMSPYKSLNIREFWRRWHITLGRFLREYVYVPLGGNRHGYVKTYSNLFLTFLIGGLWHGAGWTFVFWGALHGSAMLIYLAWRKWNIGLPKVMAWFLTFNFVNLTWIFFRAGNWDDAVKILKGMVGMTGVVLPERLAGVLPFLKGKMWVNMQAGPETLAVLSACFCLAVFTGNSNELTERIKPNMAYSLALGIISISSIISIGKYSEFIYFRF